MEENVATGGSRSHNQDSFPCISIRSTEDVTVDHSTREVFEVWDLCRDVGFGIVPAVKKRCLPGSRCEDIGVNIEVFAKI